MNNFKNKVVNNNINQELNYVYNFNKYDFSKNDFDSNIKLENDFNLYVNNKWKNKNPIPDKHVCWGSFQILHEETKLKLKELVNKEYNEDDLKNIHILFKVGMNENKINNDDIKPLNIYLNELKNIKTKNELFVYLSKLYKLGLTGIFGIGPSEDAKNSKLYVPHLYGGGLSLPDRDYYFMEDKKEFREKYFDYVKNLFKLLDYNEKNSINITEKIIDIETQLAEVTYKEKKEESRKKI